MTDYDNKNLRILASVAIINYQGRFLMVTRKNGEFSGYLETPGGHIEQGETPEEAVIREVKEEAVVDVRIIKSLGIIENNNSVCHYFDCELSSPKQIEKNKHIKLVSTDDFLKFKITPFALENLIKLGFCKKY